MISRRDLLTTCAGLVLPVASTWSATPANGYSLRFEWLEQGQADPAGGRLDLGRLFASTAAIRERRMTVSRRVAVRIDGPGTTARITAALVDEPRGFIIRVNALPLSILPRVIDPALRVGAAVTYAVEVEIPAQAAPGPFLGRIEWRAETP